MTAALPVPRVLAVASHPIQYQAPWFRALAQSPELDFSVLFVQMPDAQQQGRGFGVPFTWDVPLLDGYAWRRVTELKGDRGLEGFFGSRIAHPARELASPDVLLLTGWHVWPLLQVLMAARARRIPVVMRGESNALRRRPVAARVLHRLLLAQCSTFLPIGRTSRDFYAGYGVAAERLFDAPYFVDNARFIAAAQAVQPRLADVRARWGIPEGAVCFCYAGKLEPKKRILDLLEGLRLAAPRSATPLHLLVVGTGELMEAAQAQVKQHRLPVSFTGFLNQTEIPSAYAASDCLVLPSDFGETWGLVVNEAMACGRPALVSDRVGCGQDLVTPGVTGEMFAFGDAGALAAKLVQLAADPPRLRAMGEAARARVLADYTVERASAATVAAVKHALGRA